ncbi:MAG TPA: MOSC domain-containing protein, partial [Clostridia bacterium]|nr:MOSC domain-containing protein [Clostridia bacterium]
MASVVSVNISGLKGVCKEAVDEVKLIKDFGIEGDAHAGNWHRQLSLLAQESVDKLTALGAGEFKSGIFAENIRTEGLVLHTLPIGTKLRIGECLVEVTQIGKECHQHCEIYKKVGQ